MDTKNIPDRTVTVPRETLTTLLGATGGMLDIFRKQGIDTPLVRLLQDAHDELMGYMGYTKERVH